MTCHREQVQSLIAQLDGIVGTGTVPVHPADLAPLRTALVAFRDEPELDPDDPDDPHDDDGNRVTPEWDGFQDAILREQDAIRAERWSAGKDQP